MTRDHLANLFEFPDPVDEHAARWVAAGVCEACSDISRRTVATRGG